MVLNGSSSLFLPIESGVAQGSVLGPLSFLVYINDLEINIKSKIKFFADDTMLFSVVHDPDLTAKDLNLDLNTIKNWAYQWKMSFNPDPSKQAVEILFSQKKPSVLHPPIYFNDNIVLRKDAHKHLGITLDSKLTFSDHITEKMRITNKHI